MPSGSQNFSQAFLEINGVNLSAYVREIAVNLSAEALDDSAMGDTYRSKIGGPRDAGFAVTFNQDFGAGAVHQTLIGAIGTSACYEVRGVNTCTAPDNPSVSGIAIMTNYDVLAGPWGALLTSPIQFAGKGSPTFASSSG